MKPPCAWIHYCGAGFQVCEGLGTDAQFYRNVPLGIPGVGHRSVEMRICSPRFFQLRDRFGYRRLVSVKCSPCLLKKKGSYFEKPASVPKLMQTMGNISYQSLDCAPKSRKSRKTVGNKFEKSSGCAQLVNIVKNRGEQNYGKGSLRPNCSREESQLSRGEH